MTTSYRQTTTMIRKCDLYIHRYDDGTYDIAHVDGEVWGPYDGFTTRAACAQAFNKALALFGDSDEIKEKAFCADIYNIIGR